MARRKESLPEQRRWWGEPTRPPRSYHGNALRVAVQVGGSAAAAWGLAASAAGVLQGGHQGLIGDGTKLVAEGSIENENVDNKDPLADGSQVLQEEALVDKEDATWSEVKGKSEKKMALPGGCQVPKHIS